MTFRNVYTATLALLMFMPVCQVSAKSDGLPETTVEGLVRVPDSKLAIVYADPAADLSAYDSVMILEPYVAFKKNWARNQRSAAGSLSAAPKPADMERIKTLMASEFIEVFDEVLSEGGYTVTDQSGENVLLVRPAIFMNHSGQALRAVMDYFRIGSAQALVAYDELDLPPGVARLKRGGGHGGHNGLRDIFRHVADHDFLRLRIGIGHPGHRDDVTGHVLKPASREERDAIETAIDVAMQVLPDIVAGKLDSAMKILHTERVG